MRTEQILLPSRATIIIRGLTIEDESLLARMTKMSERKSEKVMIDLVQKCTLEIVDPGPYANVTDLTWRDMAQGDFWWTLIKIGAISYPDGNKYYFKAQHKSAQCGKVGDYRLDLLEDLPVQDLPEESFEKMLAGDLFEMDVDGHKITFGVPLVKDSARLLRMEEEYPDREMGTALRSRIVEVDGIEKRQILDWLDGRGSGFDPMDAYWAEKMRDQFDEVNCGVDNEVEVECRYCGEEFVATIPFDRGLLMPSRGIKDRRLARRRGRGSSAT